MNGLTSLNFILLLSLFIGCKTTEEIRKERLVNDLSSKMEESQTTLEKTNRISTENQLKLQEIEDQMVQMSSELEILKSDQIEKNSERLKVLETEVVAIREELSKQNEYIQEVLETLKKIGESNIKNSSSSKKKEKSNNDGFDTAYSLFGKKEYTKSLPLFQALIESNKLDAIKTNKALHALGVIHFSQKKYEESITYLSKIITKYPKSSLAASSYLYIGKSLQKMGKKEESKEAFDSIIELFPNSDEAKEAERLKK